MPEGLSLVSAADDSPVVDRSALEFFFDFELLLPLVVPSSLLELPVPLVISSPLWRGEEAGDAPFLLRVDLDDAVALVSGEALADALAVGAAVADIVALGEALAPAATLALGAALAFVLV